MMDMTVLKVISWKRVSDSLLLVTVIFKHSQWKTDVVEVTNNEYQPAYIQSLWTEINAGTHGTPESE